MHVHVHVHAHHRPILTSIPSSTYTHARTYTCASAYPTRADLPPSTPALGQALLHFLEHPEQLPRSYIDEVCPVFDCCCAPGTPLNVSEETRAALRIAAAAATGEMPPRDGTVVDAPRLSAAAKLLVDGTEDSAYRNVVNGRLGGLPTKLKPAAAVAAAATLPVAIAVVARRRRRARAAAAKAALLV